MHWVNIYKVQYIHLIDVLSEIEMEWDAGKLKNKLKQYKRYQHLIIDESLLSPVYMEGNVQNEPGNCLW